MQIFSVFFFCDFVKKRPYLCIVQRFFIYYMFFICVSVISFGPIKAQTRSTPQNERLNISFVKDIMVAGKKLARNCPRTDCCQLQIFSNTLYYKSSYNFLSLFGLHDKICQSSRSPEMYHRFNMKICIFRKFVSWENFIQRVSRKEVD